MMKTTCYISTILISILLLASCTIEKRLHQPGWHVEWKKQLPTRETETAAENPQAANDLPLSAVRSLPDPVAQADDNNVAAADQEHPGISEIADPELTEPLEEHPIASPPADDTLKRKVVVIRESELPNRKTASEAGVGDPLTILLWTLSIFSILLISATVVLALFASPSSALLLALLFAELPFLILIRSILAVFIRKRERDQGIYRHSDNLVLAVILPELYLIFVGVLLFLLLLLLL